MSKKGRKLFRIGSLAGLILVVSLVNTHAQVITPSLDPTLPSILPITAGRRAASSFGIGSGSGNGQADTVSVPNTREITIQESSAVLALKSEDFSLEAQLIPDSRADYQDASSDGYQTNSWLIMACLAGDNISLGASRKQQETDYPHRSKTVVSGYFGFGLAFRLLDALHVGGGRTRSWENRSDLVKNTWVDYYLGLAWTAGPLENPFFRIEVSTMHSPKTRTDSIGTPGTADYREQNVHQEKSENRIALEMKRDALLLSYFQQDSTSANDETGTGFRRIDDTRTTEIRYGAGYLPENGWILTLYQRKIEEETVYTLSNGNQRRSKEWLSIWQLQIGYSF